MKRTDYWFLFQTAQSLNRFRSKFALEWRLSNLHHLIESHADIRQLFSSRFFDGRGKQSWMRLPRLIRQNTDSRFFCIDFSSGPRSHLIIVQCVRHMKNIVDTNRQLMFLVRWIEREMRSESNELFPEVETRRLPILPNVKWISTNVVQQLFVLFRKTRNDHCHLARFHRHQM